MAVLFNFQTRTYVITEEISAPELEFRNDVLRQAKRPLRWCSREVLTDEFIDEMISMLIPFDPDEKRYIIHWQSPGLKGTKNIGCSDFRKIGSDILKDLFPPVACPTIITKIELIEPEKYLKK